MSLRADLQATLGAAYTIERELTGGGMAELFVARDNTLNRLVVVKVVSVLGASHRSVDRFRREVALAAQLQHPHIVSVLGAGQVGELPYFIMPYVEGESLRRRLDQEGALPLRESIGILRDVARALAYAHERGVVHRDIKPDNVLLAGGSASLTDFGIAKALASTGEQKSGAPLTQEGITVGTPGYMSPEQVAGDPATDHRADIYAFGVLAYEMLTGRTPFHGMTPHELMTAQFTTPAPAISGARAGMPGGLAALVMSCLEISPANRPQSAGELVRALDEPSVVSGSQTATVPLSVIRRKRARRAAVIAASIVAVLVAGFWIWSRNAAAAAPPRSVAVLPLANASGDSAASYFAEGLTDEIALALAKLPGVRVAARGAAASYRGRTASPRDVGRVLNVATVLEGSVQVSGGRLRLFAQLTNARDGLSLWSQRFEGAVNDLFTLQDSLASAVAEALRNRFGGAPLGAPRGEAGTADVAAYDLFLRGRFLFRRRSAESLREAVTVFKQAIARDSGFARAWAGLADAYAVLPLYGGIDPDSSRELALDYVERAVALDSTLADALASRGNLLMGAWRWAEAEQDFKRAIDLDSSNVNAWQWYGEWSIYNGRVEDAVRMFGRAAELDPTSPLEVALEGVALAAANRFPEAIAATTHAVAMDTTLPVTRLMHGMVLVYAGRYADAIPQLNAARRMAGDVPNIIGALGYALAAGGQRERAEALRDSVMRHATTSGATSVLSHINLGLGDTAQALTWLEWAAGGRDPFFSSEPLSAPIWNSIRHSPRFAQVVRRVGLDSSLTH